MVTPSGQFPRQVRSEFDSEAVATASNQDKIAYIAPFAGTVQAVNYVPTATLTGANTNSRTVSLINTGQAGAGSTVMATVAFTTGVNAPADQAKVITLSGTAANLDFAAGDVLVWRSTAVGTGLADPGGLVDLTVVSA
jgi:hypothetical protein